MKTFGLVGFPLTQSFSQKYFTAKFAELQIDARYLNFSIEHIGLFSSDVIKTPELIGLNVTIPYKEQVIPYLDQLDETASKVGAVNVIKVKMNENSIHLKGYNSDVVGFENSLLPLLKKNHTKALILGTGGASKAVKYVLDKLGIESLYVSRNADKIGVIGYSDVTHDLISDYHLIVNTTPLGMYPKTDDFPAIPYDTLTSNHLCYDLIYNPEVTQFLAKAQITGAQIKNGHEMLVKQAERAWEIWNSD